MKILGDFFFIFLVFCSVLVSTEIKAQSFLSLHSSLEEETPTEAQYLMEGFFEDLQVEGIKISKATPTLPEMEPIDVLIRSQDIISALSQLEEMFDSLNAGIHRRSLDDSIARKLWIRAALLTLLGKTDLEFQFEHYADLISHGITEIGTLGVLLKQIKNLYFRSRLMMREIKLFIEKGENGLALRRINEMTDSGEFSEEIYGELQHFREMIVVASDVNPIKIGVILPLSHPRFGPLGKQVMDGLELYLSEIDPYNESLELVIRDPYSESSFTKGDKSKSPEKRSTEEQVANIVKELVEKEKVIAIIGPLTRSNSVAAGEAAEKYLIPVISFSLTDNIGEKIPFLFRFQKNRIEEARTLISYSMDYLNAKRFLVFYEATQSGLRQLKEVIASIERKGGTITGAVRIKKKQADFQKDLLAATGGLRYLSEEEKDEMKQTRERIEPIVDFDAMFLPVNQTQYLLLSSFISLFDMNRVWRLGGSKLNTNENKHLRYVARLRFVDSYPSGKRSVSLGDFFEKHWKSFGHRPRYKGPTSYTVYGYEIMGILEQQLQKPLVLTRATLANSLRTLKEHLVLTGTVSTEETGEITKALKILRIKKRDTVEIF